MPSLNPRLIVTSQTEPDKVRRTRQGPTNPAEPCRLDSRLDSPRAVSVPCHRNGEDRTLQGIPPVIRAALDGGIAVSDHTHSANERIRRPATGLALSTFDFPRRHPER